MKKNTLLFIAIFIAVSIAFTNTAAQAHNQQPTISSDATINSAKPDIQKSITKEQYTFKSQVSFSDPGFTSDSNKSDAQWYLPKVGLLTYVSTVKIDSNIIVAILDTGLDMTHEDLQDGNYVQGFDFINHKKIMPGTNTDDNGHGTIVTGIISASANNGKGIIGSAPGVKIMPIKVLDSTGTGTSTDLVNGIKFAADNGANIINISLGGVGFEHDQQLADAITYAYDRGILIVAAAGNDTSVNGISLDAHPSFPICNDNGNNMVLGVAAIGINNKKLSFSNFGKNCIDVSAPGEKILSTINRDPKNGNYLSNAYAYASGTSMATPIVTSEAVILKSLYPYLNHKQLRDRIIKNSNNIDGYNLSDCHNFSCIGQIGSGLINVNKAVEYNSIGTVIPVTVEGELVEDVSTGTFYLIKDGKKKAVSAFVKQQRFASHFPQKISTSSLEQYGFIGYLEPLDGTLFKSVSSSTVYIYSQGVKRPITYQVFLNNKFNFDDIVTLSDVEVNTWTTGSFLPPIEGTLIKSSKKQTVYWVVNSVLHAINYNFFLEKGLNVFPVEVYSDNDIKSFVKGEDFIR